MHYVLPKNHFELEMTDYEAKVQNAKKIAILQCHVLERHNDITYQKDIHLRKDNDTRILEDMQPTTAQ